MKDDYQELMDLELDLAELLDLDQPDLEQESLEIDLDLSDIKFGLSSIDLDLDEIANMDIWSDDLPDVTGAFISEFRGDKNDSKK